MSRGATVLAALLVTLGRPTWWLLALAAFLARGAFLLFLLPIVELPSPLAISNSLAPVIVPVALGRVGLEAILLLGAFAGALGAWLLLGGSLGAAVDATLAREAVVEAIEEGVGSRTIATSSGRLDGVGRQILAARLAAAIPLAVAFALGIAGIVAATYVELTRPDELGLPLAVRVALGSLGQLVGIAVTWVFGEVVAGAATRRIVIYGAAPGAALWAATRDVVLRPGRDLAPWLLVTLLMAAALTGLLWASSVAWQSLRLAILTPSTEPLPLVLALGALVAIWLAALLVAGLFGAARATIGTFEHVRTAMPASSDDGVMERGHAPGPGTFGASAHHRPGDWSDGDRSGSL